MSEFKAVVLLVMKFIAPCITSFLICCLTANAAQTKRVISIHRAPYSPPLTGTLTNPGWRDASVFTDFHPVKPKSGGKPTERTSAYVMYDKDNLYVALRMFDTQPDKIRAEAKHRDDPGTDDWAAIYIDPTEDHLSAVYFLVTPGGIQADGSLDPNGKRNPALNMDWTSVVRKGSSGWIAEISIPWKSMRVELKPELVMGLKFARFISRSGEEDNGLGISADASLAEFQQVRFAPKE